MKKEFPEQRGYSIKLIPLEQYETLVLNWTAGNRKINSYLITGYSLSEISDLEDNLKKTRIQKTEITVKIKQEEISNEKFISKVLKEKIQSYKNYLVSKALYPKSLLNLHVKYKMLSYTPVSGTVLELEDRFRVQ